MLGFNSDTDPTISPKRKKFDHAFTYVVVAIAIIGLGFVVSESYLHLKDFARYGVYIIAFALVANLIKGAFDYRDKKRRKAEIEAEGGWAAYAKKHRLELIENTKDKDKKSDEDTEAELEAGTPIKQDAEQSESGEAKKEWTPDSETPEPEITFKVPFAFQEKTKYTTADPFAHVETIAPVRRKKGEKNINKKVRDGFTHRQRLGNSTDSGTEDALDPSDFEIGFSYVNSVGKEPLFAIVTPIDEKPTEDAIAIIKKRISEPVVKAS